MSAKSNDFDIRHNITEIPFEICDQMITLRRQELTTLNDEDVKPEQLFSKV